MRCVCHHGLAAGGPHPEPRAKRHHGFTIVELLVVITIIWVLAALRLATFDQARQSARAVMCLNNLKQTVAGMNLYNADWRRPVECQHNIAYPGRQPTEYAGDGKLNAWGVLHTTGYIADDQLRCVAKKLVPAGRTFGTGPTGWTHYNYRYNSTWNMPRIFELQQYLRQALVCDDATMGITAPVPLSQPYGMDAQQVIPERWGHVAGGNAMRLDASGRFIANFWNYSFPAAADGWPNSGRGWPSWYYWGSWTLIDPYLTQ